MAAPRLAALVASLVLEKRQALFLYRIRGAHHLVHGGQALSGENDGGAAKVLVSGLLARRRLEFRGVLRVQGFDQRIIHFQKFKNTETARVAGAVAMAASAPTLEFELVGLFARLRL